MKALWITACVIILDQLTKFYIKGIKIPFLNIDYVGMYPGESFSVIGDFFRITFTENPGMAFGFDPGSDFKLWISIFSLAASIGLLIYLYAVRHKLLSLKIAIALILGGAVGNLIDRMFYGLIYDYSPVFYGKVVDFLDFDFFNFSLLGRSYDRWPIFNIADASVTIGVLILLFFYKQHQKEDEADREKEAAELRLINNMQSGDNIPSDGKDNSREEELTDEQSDKGKEISL
jgi:signal peptidase II